jgi:hypothetical protein
MNIQLVRENLECRKSARYSSQFIADCSRVNNEKATASSKSSENNLNNYYCWQEEEKTATW